MRRGDVVQTVAELEALPIGTEVVDMDARRFKTNAGGAYPCDALGIASIQYPALVRVVGPVEPEWLEAAAVAGYRQSQGNDSMIEKFSDLTTGGGPVAEHWLGIARAAVAAADKARGIVNSREELDALEVGTRVKSVRAWRRGNREHQSMDYLPTHWPVVIDDTD